MDELSAVHLLQSMDGSIACFASLVSKNELFEPNLRLSRQIVERFRSGIFSSDQIVEEINSLEDHHNGHGWRGFVGDVADYLKLFGQEHEVDYCFALVPGGTSALRGQWRGSGRQELRPDDSP